MKTSELIKALTEQLAEHGDLDVLMIEPNDHSVYAISSAGLEKVKRGDYPKEWNMPKKFIALENF